MNLESLVATALYFLAKFKTIKFMMYDGAFCVSLHLQRENGTLRFITSQGKELY